MLPYSTTVDTHTKQRLNAVFMCSPGEFILGDILPPLQHSGFFKNFQLLKILPLISPPKETITSCVFPRETLVGRKKFLTCIFSFSKAPCMIWDDWHLKVCIHGCCSLEKWKAKSASSSKRLVPSQVHYGQGGGWGGLMRTHHPSYCWELVIVGGGNRATVKLLYQLLSVASIKILWPKAA